MSYDLLTKACGGSLSPESLTEFEKRLKNCEFEDHPNCDRIIRQYREFMYDMGCMFAPVDWSREAKLEHLLSYISDKIGDMASTASEDADDIIRADIQRRIGAVL